MTDLPTGGDSQSAQAPSDAPQRGRGAPPASERNPESLCGAPTQGGSGPPCKRFKANETGKCPKHGSGTPQARDRAEVARATAALGLPAVPVRDYPDMVGQHIAVLSEEVERINLDLDKRRLMDLSEVEVQREFGDVLSQRDQRLGVIAKLAGSVARLSAAKAANTAADAGAEFLRSQSFAQVLAVLDDAVSDFPPEYRDRFYERLGSLLTPGAAAGPVVPGTVV